jgi:hypothetical protein
MPAQNPSAESQSTVERTSIEMPLMVALLILLAKFVPLQLTWQEYKTMNTMLCVAAINHGR